MAETTITMSLWPLHWFDANTAASASEYVGLSGHLVTITSEDENLFVFALIDNDEYWASESGGYYRGPWIGGTAKVGATLPYDPLNDWEWVTGEAFTYQNWRPGEPNGDGGGVHFADDPGRVRSAEWNDLPSEFPLNGYVVEYQVPEPSTLAIFGVGMVGLLSYAWRRKPAA